MDVLKLINSVNKKIAFELEYDLMSDGHLLTISVSKNKSEDLVRLFNKIIKKFKCENLSGFKKPTSPVFGKNREKVLYSIFFAQQEEITKTIKFIGTHQ